LVPVGREVWTKFLAADLKSPRQLVEGFGRSLATKHLQIWTMQEGRALASLGVDGGLRKPAGRDYLLLVGQNAAGNKIDYYARRHISYGVHIATDGKTTGKAVVELANDAPSGGLPRYLIGPFGSLRDPPGLNRSYLSIYSPLGAAVSGASVDGKAVQVESHRELGLGVVSRYVEALSGKSATFKVNLTSVLSRLGEYRLLVQHQPGLRADALDLSISLPAGATPGHMSPGLHFEGGAVRWSGPLVADREFVIEYR